MSPRGPGGGGGDWVPLFIAKDPTGPLTASINLIEPTPRRSRFPSDAGIPGTSSSGGGQQQPLSPTDSEISLDNYIAQHTPSPAFLQPPAMIPFRLPSHEDLAVDEGVSSSLSPRSSPRLAQVAGFISGAMQRTASSTSIALSRVGSQMGGHSRRRSSGSQTELHSLIHFPEYEGGEDDRKRGLRRMMGSPGGSPDWREREETDKNWGHLIKLFLAVLAFGLLIPLSQVALSAAEQHGGAANALGKAIQSAKQSLHMNDAKAEAELAGVSKSHAGEWWQALPAAIYNHFETVPYPLSTHPRTPNVDDNVSFPAYLSTRLGSHFGVPSTASKDPGGRAAAQLWLTTATSDTINLAARHLRGYVAELDKKGELSTEAVRAKDGHDRYARRQLVVLCLDSGCLAQCRKDPSRLCYGGWVGEDERRAKQLATIEALESGRRVFLVDGGIYFKPDLDPIEFVGAFKSFDLQVPEFWTTSMEQDAGFAVLNPTQAVISLLYRIVEISHLPSLERASWASTNLLLDPTGAGRGHKLEKAPERTKAMSAADEDEGLYDDEALSGGYGQAEFESAWGGGLDVKVLSRIRFRESTGKLDDDAVFQPGKAIFFHCACCGDAENVDFIAGSLGFHHPSVLYPPPNPHTGFPDLPLALRTQGLSGAKDELAFAVSVLLQLTADSGRTFVPPLKVSLAQKGIEEKVERYWWRVFPVQKWNSEHIAHADDGAVIATHVREPSFIVHAIEHFRKHFTSAPYAVAAVLELETPTLFDLSPFETYEDALVELQRGVLGSTRVVEVEGFDAVRGRAGWSKVEGRGEQVEMCGEEEKSLKKLEGGTCEVLCVRRTGEERRTRRTFGW